MLHYLLLDNYDSFTYNLQHYMEGLDVKVDVIRNDKEIDVSIYDGVVLSPGPGQPKDHPGLLKVIDDCLGKIPVLGVCLGMQAIAERLDGELNNKTHVKHGVREEITVLNNDCLFRNLPQKFDVGLYHSWFVLPSKGYQVDAVSTEEDVIMAISRPDKLLYGVQFHPESIMSEHGKSILKAFIGVKGLKRW